MPVYTSYCEECSKAKDYHSSIAERLNTPPCAACGGETSLVILQAPMGFVRGRFEPFRSNVDGTIIANHRDMDEHNRRNGVVCLADGYSDEKVRSGSFERKEETLDVGELRDDLGAALLAVKDGYKPNIEVHNE